MQKTKERTHTYGIITTHNIHKQKLAKQTATSTATLQKKMTHKQRITNT